MADTLFPAGTRLSLPDGSVVDAHEALKDKPHVLLYFSANFCGPCQEFTPLLTQWLDEISDANPAAAPAIIFVSSDLTKEEYEIYRPHHPWLALPWEETIQLRADIKRKFGVCARVEEDSLGSGMTRVNGIPSLTPLKANDGKPILEFITRDGRRDVEVLGPKALKKWGW
jgi:nucleoredoxin